MTESMRNCLFSGVYKGKTVLVTGNTGFKGSWLSVWLHCLGANVVGYSAYLPSRPCNFLASGMPSKIKHFWGDVRDFNAMRKVFSAYKPDFVFHLAAQPIVRKSFLEPKLTFETNVLGTVNILECIRKCSSVRSAVIITSDKCYRNMEWERGYKEGDILGGDDPYSASKACAELAVNSYIKSFFGNKISGCRIATARAGNVIGGGDWAKDRIMPDCVRSWSKKKTVLIRNPYSTRPWQHVLEPLSGYLYLGALLLTRPELNGEPFNFGPKPGIDESVKDLIGIFGKHFGFDKWRLDKNAHLAKESKLLKLNCEKARKRLKWNACLSFEESIILTSLWYRQYYRKRAKDMFSFSVDQIKSYILKAKQMNLPWARSDE